MWSTSTSPTSGSTTPSRRGIIGTWAGPRDPGTAAVQLMHHQGDLDGGGSDWGYVEGGMGMVSSRSPTRPARPARCSPAGSRSRAIVPARASSSRTGPGSARADVICNADPKVALRLLGGQAIDSVDRAYRERLEAWDVRSPVVKFNAALESYPLDRSRRRELAGAAMIELTGGIDAAQAAFEGCAAGEPAVGFAEVYTQTASTRTRPPG